MSDFLFHSWWFYISVNGFITDLVVQVIKLGRHQWWVLATSFPQQCCQKARAELASKCINLALCHVSSVLAMILLPAATPCFIFLLSIHLSATQSLPSSWGYVRPGPHCSGPLNTFPEDSCWTSLTLCPGLPGLLWSALFTPPAPPLITLLSLLCSSLTGLFISGRT